MDVLLLCISAILIARYAEKRSKIVTVVHTVLFIVLLAFSCFTTPFAPVREAVSSLIGAESYILISGAIATPVLWLYSASAAIFATELLLLLIVAVWAAVHAAKKLLKRAKRIVRSVRASKSQKVAAVRFIKADNKLFYTFCRLLN